MGLLGSLFRSSTILGIAEETLQFALKASEQTHPDEYMGLLRATAASELGLTEDGQLITDVLVIPGTQSNSVSATMKTNMVPNDHQAVGSVHSHPNGVLKPSTKDRQSFSRGSVHIIIGAPYQTDTWRAFDSSGEPIELPVYDVELPDGDDLFYFNTEELR